MRQQTNLVETNKSTRDVLYQDILYILSLKTNITLCGHETQLRPKREFQVISDATMRDSNLFIVPTRHPTNVTLLQSTKNSPPLKQYLYSRPRYTQPFMSNKKGGRYDKKELYL